MKTIKLTRDGDKDVMFTGELLAKGSSRKNDSTRWTEIRLFKSKAGNYIASVVGRSLWEGEHNRYQVHLCGSSTESVIEALREEGHLGWLAKDVLAEAGIETAEFVE